MKVMEGRSEQDKVTNIYVAADEKDTHGVYGMSYKKRHQTTSRLRTMLKAR